MLSTQRSREHVSALSRMLRSASECCCERSCECTKFQSSTSPAASAVHSTACRRFAWILRASTLGPCARARWRAMVPSAPAVGRAGPNRRAGRGAQGGGGTLAPGAEEADRALPARALGQCAQLRNEHHSQQPALRKPSSSSHSVKHSTECNTLD